MQTVSYDSRRPCEPIITPSQSRVELRAEARELDRLSNMVEGDRIPLAAWSRFAPFGGDLSRRLTRTRAVLVSR